MNKQIPILLGVALIVMGVLALSCNLGVLLLELNGWHWGPWRLWPMIVVGTGLLFIAPPLLAREKPALGGLFIPGLPVLATGAILLFASLFDAWGIWAWLWPLEVLALATGLVFAALYMRANWLYAPAMIVGASGLLLQFRAVTHLWRVWLALWNLEPFWWLLKLTVPAVLIVAGLVVLIGSLTLRKPSGEPIVKNTVSAAAEG